MSTSTHALRAGGPRSWRHDDAVPPPDLLGSLRVPGLLCSATGRGRDLSELRDPAGRTSATELLATLRAADGLLARLRAASPSGAAAASASATVSAPIPDPEPVSVTRRTTRPALSAMSVPKILLGLGALCLLVAAVIFLAVAWSWLGVGGARRRLAALTVLSAGGRRVCRRGLRVAAQALTTVGLGLLALDVVGADNAGWLGDLDVAGLTCVVGGTVLAAALALALTTGLAAPQVAAGLALSALGLGATARSEHVTTGGRARRARLRRPRRSGTETRSPDPAGRRGLRGRPVVARPGAARARRRPGRSVGARLVGRGPRGGPARGLTAPAGPGAVRAHACAGGPDVRRGVRGAAHR